MQRPDLATLACVKPAGPRFRLTGQDHLTVRQVYAQDHRRLRRCRTGGAEGSERRGTALCQTTSAEERAAAVVAPLGEGGGVRATARRGHVATDTVARLLRTAGRHAERCHAGRGRAGTPRAVEWAAPWSCVTKSRRAARWRSAPRLAPWGPRRRSPPTAHCSGRSASANGAKHHPGPWCTLPSSVSVRGLCRRSAPRPRTAMRRPSSTPWGGALRPPATAPPARPVVPSYAGPQAERTGR